MNREELAALRDVIDTVLTRRRAARPDTCAYSFDEKATKAKRGTQ